MLKLRALCAHIDVVIKCLYKERISHNLLKFLNHEKTINVSAIDCVMRAFQKVMSQCERGVEDLIAHDNDTNRKQFLTNSCFLSRFVSILISTLSEP